MIQIETLRPAPELAELLTRPGDPSISPEVRATQNLGYLLELKAGLAAEREPADGYLRLVRQILGLPRADRAGALRAASFLLGEEQA
jgi:hypothetical protein